MIIYKTIRNISHKSPIMNTSFIFGTSIIQIRGRIQLLHISFPTITTFALLLKYNVAVSEQSQTYRILT